MQWSDDTTLLSRRTSKCFPACTQSGHPICAQSYVLFPPPAFRERRHRGLARRLVSAYHANRGRLGQPRLDTVEQRSNGSPASGANVSLRAYGGLNRTPYPLAKCSRFGVPFAAPLRSRGIFRSPRTSGQRSAASSFIRWMRFCKFPTSALIAWGSCVDVRALTC